MSNKFLYLFNLPKAKKGCGVISLKLASQLAAIATLAYIALTFFEYYELNGLIVNDQFYFYMIQIYGAVSVCFILYGSFKNDHSFVSLGFMLHTLYAVIRLGVFTVLLILVLFVSSFGNLIKIILYVGLEFLAMIYFNYIFYSYEDSDEIGFGNDQPSNIVADSNYVPPSNQNENDNNNQI